MENGKPLMLHITSSQSDSQGTIDSMEFYTEGKYYETQDSRYISYEESEISGLQGTTTTLKLGKVEAVLIRSGALSSRMTFRIGCETKNEYRTEYGVFDLSVLTHKLDISICNSLINSVYLKYRLSINDGEVYTNEMTIRVSYNA
ncbi:MAG: YwiB family protein [Clostridia bacterium]